MAGNGGLVLGLGGQDRQKKREQKAKCQFVLILLVCVSQDVCRSVFSCSWKLQRRVEERRGEPEAVYKGREQPVSIWDNPKR